MVFSAFVLRSVYFISSAAAVCRRRTCFALHLGELLEEGVVLLEAFLGALEHLHRLVLADLLDELLEAVLAKLLRDGVRSPSLSLRVCSRTA